MAGELFTRTEVDFGGAMTAEFGLIVPNRGLTGVLMQNLSFQYAQNVTRIYELGEIGEMTNVYYISGRAQGTVSVQHTIGPGTTMSEYYTNFSDVCQAEANDIQLSLTPNICATDETGETVAYTANYCVLVSIGVSVAAQDFVVSHGSQLMFSGLTYDGN